MKVSVAIDGPAAAGKSTIANIVAQKFNFMYINTGAMYRAVTLMCIRQNISYTDVNKVCEITKSLKMHFK